MHALLASSALGGHRRRLEIGRSSPSTSDGPPFEWAPFAITLWSLAVAPHADTDQRVLASGQDFDLWQESFSANGRWIVFVATNPRMPVATQALYVIPSTGGDSTHWRRLWTSPIEAQAASALNHFQIITISRSASRTPRIDGYKQGLSRGMIRSCRIGWEAGIRTPIHGPETRPSLTCLVSACVFCVRLWRVFICVYLWLYSPCTRWPVAFSAG